MSIKLKQELTLQQKLKMELSQSLQLSQKLELKMYLKLQDYFDRLYDEAKKENYCRNGLDFEYAVIGKKDLPKNFPLDLGFCIIKYDGLLGEVQETLRFVVRDACKPFEKQHRDQVAVHEYGESLILGHQEASVLEWGMAKKEGILAPYLDWTEEVAPAKLCDLAHYSMLWDMMPDEVIRAADKAAMNSDERKALLEIMRNLGMPDEVRAACRRFEGMKQVAQQMIAKFENRATILEGEMLSLQERTFAARYMMQSVARQLFLKQLPWLSNAINPDWKDACSRVSELFAKQASGKGTTYLEKLSQVVSKKEQEEIRWDIEDLGEPIPVALPSTLRQAAAIEQVIASKEARITSEMDAKSILKEYLKLANKEAGKSADKTKADNKNQRAAKRFLISYIFARAAGRLSDMGLDSNTIGGVTDETVRWWSRSVHNMNKRYARKNDMDLFHPKDAVLARNLRSLISFYDEYCSPKALPPKQEKKNLRKKFHGFAGTGNRSFALSA